MEISKSNILNLKEKFDSFEEKNKILLHDYSYIWEGIRFTVFDLIIIAFLENKNSHDSITPNALSLLEKIKFGYYLIKRYIQTKPFVLFNKKKIDYVLWGHSRRKLESDGYYWDIYIDPIVSYLEDKRYFILENQYLFKHFIPAKTKNLFYPDYMMFEIAMKRILSHKSKINKDKLRYYEELQRKLNIEFETNIEILSTAIRYEQLYSYKCKQYSKLLWKANPKVLFVVVGYGREPLIHVAKDLHIPVVELQHGVLSKYHLGYDVSSGIKKDFADYFFSFGPVWGQMAHFPISQERIIPIGYQYLNTAVSKLKDAIKKDQILFLSQGTIGDRLSDFAVNLLEHIPSHVSIVFKLHPGEYLRWKTEYKSLYDASEKGFLTVVAGDNPPLYELMAVSKWQIGVNSTALFEGMAFKCKTYIVDLPGIEYVETLIDNNEFILVQKPEQIEFTYDPNELNYRTEEYFSQDTETKFKAAIDFVMKDYYA